MDIYLLVQNLNLHENGGQEIKEIGSRTPKPLGTGRHFEHD